MRLVVNSKYVYFFFNNSFTNQKGIQEMVCLKVFLYIIEYYLSEMVLIS